MKRAANRQLARIQERAVAGGWTLDTWTGTEGEDIYEFSKTCNLFTGERHTLTVWNNEDGTLAIMADGDEELHDESFQRGDGKPCRIDPRALV